MTFIEKVNNLLKKLEETNYEYFDKDKEEALDFVEEYLNKLIKYINIVVKEQEMKQIWKLRYDGEQLRDHLQDIDKERSIIHDAAINSLNILNRLSENLGLEPFADVDTKDRHAVAELLGEYTHELFQRGIGNIH